MQCYVCGSDKEELRPYGQGGQPICFPCMISKPEREAEAKKNFSALLEAAESMSQGVVVIGGEVGPQPTGPAPLMRK